MLTPHHEAFAGIHNENVCDTVGTKAVFHNQPLWHLFVLALAH